MTDAQSVAAFGTCDGTGAAINVCLGFVPSYVKVWNCEAASDYPELEWVSGMEILSSVDNGILYEGANDADRQMLTTGGIAPYDGGLELTYDGVTDNRWEVAAGTSAEEVYVNGHYQRTSTSDAAYECIGDAQIGSSTPRDGQTCTTPPGFTIGANTDLNVNGEQLLWMVYR
jgi:hypothetical protein